MSDYPRCTQPPSLVWSVAVLEQSSRSSLHSWPGLAEEVGEEREKGEPRTVAEGRRCSGRDKSKHQCVDCCSQLCCTLCSSCHQKVADCSDYLVFNQRQAPVGEWRVRSRTAPSVSAPLYLGQCLGQWLHLPHASIFHRQSLSLWSQLLTSVLAWLQSSGSATSML